MAAAMATTAHLQEPSSSQQGFGRQSYGSHQQLASPQAAHAQVVQAVQTGQAGHPAMLQMQLTQAPFVALPGAQLTQAPYWPTDMVAYPSSPTLLERIIHQVHYYFSAENLCRDEFLRGHMDQREGWLPIQLIASFNRLRSLTVDVNLVAEALRLSPELEVCNGMVRKRHDWQRWLLPHAQLGGPTSPTPSSPDSRSDPTSPLLRTGSTGFSRVTEAPSSDTTGKVSYEQTATFQPSRSSPVSHQHGQAGGKPTHQQPLLPPSLQQQPRQPQPQQQKQKQQQQKQQQQKQQWHDPQPPRAMLAVETPSVAAGSEAPAQGRDAATSKQQSRMEPRSASSRKAIAPYAQPLYETGSAGTAQGGKLPSYGASAAAHELPSNAASRAGLETAAAAGAATSKQLPVPPAGIFGTASGKSAGKATRPSTAEDNSAGNSAGKRAAAAAPSDLDEAEELSLLQEWQLLGNGSSLADWRAAHDLWVEAQLGGALRAAAAREPEKPWETAQSSRRSARKGGPGDRKDSGNESEIGVEIGVSPLHLKDAPPLSDRSSKGEVRGSNQSKWDEGHSDQTTLLNDEDWSSVSAGSAEDPRPGSPDAHTDSAPTSGPASSPERVKRSPCKTKPADKAGAPPCKPHVLRELRDAPLLESRGSAASMLAAIDLDLVVSVTSAAAAVASRFAGAQYERLLTHTPRTRALVLKHGAERHAQMALVLVALLSLLLLPTSRLPPSLGELGAPRWLELPIGLILGLKVNDLGNKLWTLCTPCPTQHGRAA